ncbi:MAG: hypothetical protein ABIZ56_09290 [Chthoniobacteraceae bacterium]
MKTTPTILLSAIALAASTLLATAQENNQRPDRGDRGGTPEEWRARMTERIKTSLKVTDDEWTVLQPLIEKVTTKQRDAMSGRFGGFGGGRGGDRGGDRGGGGGSTTSDRPGAAESQALRDALEKDSTSPEDLKAKLNAIRESRKKAAAELVAARTDLQKVVSVRQEAVLFSMGILE